MCNYGWPSRHLPNFDLFKVGLHPDPPSKTKNEILSLALDDEDYVFSKDSKVNKPYPLYDSENSAKSGDLSPRNQKGWELLVMALIAFIRGEIPRRKLNPYKNLFDLQSVITTQYGGVLHGLAQTSIDTKFGFANAHREKVSLPPIKDTEVDYHLKNNHDSLKSESEIKSKPPTIIDGGTF